MCNHLESVGKLLNATKSSATDCKQQHKPHKTHKNSLGETIKAATWWLNQCKQSVETVDGVREAALKSRLYRQRLSVEGALGQALSARQPLALSHLIIH